MYRWVENLREKEKEVVTNVEKYKQGEPHFLYRFAAKLSFNWFYANLKFYFHLIFRFHLFITLQIFIVFQQKRITW